MRNGEKEREEAISTAWIPVGGAEKHEYKPDNGGEEAEKGSIDTARAGDEAECSESEAEAEGVERYWSWFWYVGRVCLNVYCRPGWYVSLGVHIGRDIELHLLWFIVILMGAEKGKALEDADKWYQKGIEPDE
jgi:hypothetical protein